MSKKRDSSPMPQGDMGTIADFCLSACKREGCQEAQVVATQTAEKRLVVEAGSFSLAHTLATREITIVIHKDDCMTSVKTDRLDTQSLAGVIANAVEMARFSLADSHLNFARPKSAPRAKTLPFLYDPAVAALDFAPIKEAMGDLLAMVKECPEVMLDRMEMAVDTSTHSLYNSHGLFQEERSSAVEWEFTAMAREEDCVAGSITRVALRWRPAPFAPPP